MAIDDNEDYTLTGAQVKDLAQRIKSGGGGGSNAVILYSSVSFHTPIQLADIYSDAALTTSVTGATVKGYIEAGKTVAIIYETSVSDVPQNETLIITSCDNHSEATHGVIVFTGTFFDYTNSEPVLYTLACDQPSNLWSASQKSIPAKTSELTNDGDDGVHPFLATDDVATVATTGDYNDLNNLPSDRLYRMLVPTGTEITSNKNLNTTEFLVVGRYYCSTNNTVATLSNCPTTSAFMMDVFSPLSTTIDNETTSPWCYRLRMLTTYTGATYVQQCETTGTADVWTYHSWVRTDNIQADWNASSGLAQILNRPTVRHVSSVSDAGWSGAEYHLIDGSALAYWNGAYSGTASNLKYFANSSVTTANLQNDCVTASKLYDRNTANTTDTWMLVLNGDKIQHRVVKAFNSDGSIPKSAMHGLPCPDYSTVITNWGTINSTTTKTMAGDGYIVGKALVTGTDKQAFIEIGGKQVAGIPYNATSQINNLQVAFCVPVKSGTSVKFQCSGGTGGFFQGCNLVGWQM